MNTNGGVIQINNPAADKNEPAKTFTFDDVFDWNSRQSEVYDATALPIVESCIQGYNGTVFAYGQTGCGKTHSMEGILSDPEHQGIIPRSFKQIFQTVDSAAKDTRFLIACSYLEIYNEEIRDLLANDPSKRLDLKESKDKGVYVKDLSTAIVKSVQEVQDKMTYGNQFRSKAATLMNADSSRSHSIFTVYVERSDKDETGEERIRAGKLNLVDLAGSERQGKTGATGDRLKEATKINLSLSALGNVISALVDGKSLHIPYRDSKLTRLLQDSLGGNTKTLMLCALSPADRNYDETLTTLRYANRAKNIKNKPTINEDPKDAMLRELQDEVKQLKELLILSTQGKLEPEKAAKILGSLASFSLIGGVNSTPAPTAKTDKQTAKIAASSKAAKVEELDINDCEEDTLTTAPTKRTSNNEDDHKSNSRANNKIKHDNHQSPPKHIAANSSNSPSHNPKADTTDAASTNFVDAHASETDDAFDDDDNSEFLLDLASVAADCEDDGDANSSTAFNTDDEVSDREDGPHQENTEHENFNSGSTAAKKTKKSSNNKSIAHNQMLAKMTNGSVADQQAALQDALAKVQAGMLTGKELEAARADRVELQEKLDKQRSHALQLEEEKKKASEMLEEVGTQFSNMKEELEVKTMLVKRLQVEVRRLRSENSDLTKEFDVEKADLMDTIRKLTRESKFYMQLAYTLHPSAKELKEIRNASHHDENSDKWILPPVFVKNAKEGFAKREPLPLLKGIVPNHAASNRPASKLGSKLAAGSVQNENMSSIAGAARITSTAVSNFVSKNSSNIDGVSVVNRLLNGQQGENNKAAGRVTEKIKARELQLQQKFPTSNNSDFSPSMPSMAASDGSRTGVANGRNLRSGESCSSAQNGLNSSFGSGGNSKNQVSGYSANSQNTMANWMAMSTSKENLTSPVLSDPIFLTAPADGSAFTNSAQGNNNNQKDISNSGNSPSILTALHASSLIANDFSSHTPLVSSGIQNTNNNNINNSNTKAERSKSPSANLSFDSLQVGTATDKKKPQAPAWLNFQIPVGTSPVLKHV